MQDPVAFLKALFQAGLDAADPLKIVPSHLPQPPKGRTVVIGAGKGAASMAKAVENTWPQGSKLEGLVVTQYGYGLPTSRIEVIEAAHPFPDDSAEDAARRMLKLVGRLSADDLVLALISGGGSSLMSLPAPDVTRAEKKSVISALMNAGAPISDINCVRKHLSAIKGGRLALAAYPAPIVSLIISDVPGDVPHIVASGPTLPDPTTQAQARAALEKFKVKTPDSVRAWLADPANETPKPGDARFSADRSEVIASGMNALNAAASFAKKNNVTPIVLGVDIEGEAREVGAKHVAECHKHFSGKSFVILSGGETTVTVKGSGKGGRNSEYILGAALAAQGKAHIYGLAAGTDGLDGNGGCAGAFFTPATLALAGKKGFDPGEISGRQRYRDLLRRARRPNHYRATAHERYGFTGDTGGLNPQFRRRMRRRIAHGSGFRVQRAGGCRVGQMEIGRRDNVRIVADGNENAAARLHSLPRRNVAGIVAEIDQRDRLRPYGLHIVHYVVDRRAFACADRDDVERAVEIDHFHRWVARHFIQFGDEIGERLAQFFLDGLLLGFRHTEIMHGAQIFHRLQEKIGMHVCQRFDAFMDDFPRRQRPDAAQFGIGVEADDVVIFGGDPEARCGEHFRVDGLQIAPGDDEKTGAHVVELAERLLQPRRDGEAAGVAVMVDDRLVEVGDPDDVADAFARYPVENVLHDITAAYPAAATATG